MAGKRKNRSGLLFMLTILVLLGIIIFAYKEKFQVLIDTGFNNGKSFFTKSFNKQSSQDRLKDNIKNLDDKQKKDLSERIKNNFLSLKDKLTQEEAKKPMDTIIKTNPEDTDNQLQPAELNNKINEADSRTKMVDKQESVRNSTKNKIDNTQQKIVVNPNLNKKEISKYRSMKKNIYFSVLLPEDKLKIVGVSRDIIYEDTPLTETLKTLLKGPNQAEKASNMITNIPDQTKLLSVYVKNNTAFINFSSEFEYNPYGREATLAQLKQIVYTSTEFSNVKSVQLLINGKIKTYLGGEGILINKPLSRNDFS